MTGEPHPDTMIVDRLTAFLNSETDPCGADAVDLLCQLITASGRPLLDQTWDVDADVHHDRYGITSGVITAGEYTVRVAQPADDRAELMVEITTPDGDDFGLAVVVDGRPVLDAMPCTSTSSVPADLQLTPQAEHSPC